MKIWSKPFILTAAFVAAMILPNTVSAGSDFTGVWQPYSRPAEWLGAMTVAPDRLSFAYGPQAGLEPVRAGGSIFRIVAPQGDAFTECGEQPIDYVGFHVLDNGQLARLYYSADTPPAEPTGSGVMEVTRLGACSVMFYVR